MTNTSKEKKKPQKRTPKKTRESGLKPVKTSKRLIEPDWCDRPSVEVAPDLIGCILARQLPDGPLIRSIIVETEAYAPGDPACHAYSGKSKRNAAMFGPPGHSYVYLIYGMYHCLNVVTEAIGTGSAVLIRALELEAVPPQLDSKHTAKPHRIAAGPGKLCRALEIDRDLNGALYHPSSQLWLEHPAEPSAASHLVQTTRIGITKAADKPWRWYLGSSPSVSKR